MNKKLPIERVSLTPPDWWRKWRPLRWILLAAFGWWVYSTWHTRRVDIPVNSANSEFQLFEAVRVPFLDGISSFDTVQETHYLLANQHATYTETLQAFARSPRYPDYRLVTISVPSYTAQVSSGPLTLVYFNDRLMQATFEPESPGLLARGLERSYPTLSPNASGRSIMVDGPLKITTNVLATPLAADGGLLVPATTATAADASARLARGRAYVTWEDLRLVRQLQQWDTRFGEIARKPPTLLQP